MPNIRCRNEVSDILPLPTLPYNEGSIAGTIEILREIAERLGLSDEIVRDKVILLKSDLLTVRNCRRSIYRWQGVDQPSLLGHEAEGRGDERWARIDDSCHPATRQDLGQLLVDYFRVYQS